MSNRRSHVICRSGALQALWRGLALLAALSVGLPDVARVAHLLFVQHVTCPYDGALVHADEVPAAAERQHTEAENTTGAAVAPKHDHHGCSSLSAANRPAIFVVPQQARVGCTLEELVLAQSAPMSPPKKAVLSYAPRLPPPARSFDRS